MFRITVAIYLFSISVLKDKWESGEKKQTSKEWSSKEWGEKTHQQKNVLWESLELSFICLFITGCNIKELKKIELPSLVNILAKYSKSDHPLLTTRVHQCLPCGSVGAECPKFGRPGFNPWVRKIPWRRKWRPTPVFLPGESHEQRNLWATVHGVTKSWT